MRWPLVLILNSCRHWFSWCLMLKKLMELVDVDERISSSSCTFGNSTWMKIKHIYEMYRTSGQTGKHFMRNDLENQLKTRSFRLEKWLNIPIFAKDLSKVHQFRKKVCQDFSSETHWLRGEFGREVSWLQTLRMSKRIEPFLRDVIDMIFLGREVSIRELQTTQTSLVLFCGWVSPFVTVCRDSLKRFLVQCCRTWRLPKEFRISFFVFRIDEVDISSVFEYCPALLSRQSILAILACWLFSTGQSQFQATIN